MIAKKMDHQARKLEVRGGGSAGWDGFDLGPRQPFFLQPKMRRQRQRLMKINSDAAMVRQATAKDQPELLISFLSMTKMVYIRKKGQQIVASMLLQMKLTMVQVCIFLSLVRISLMQKNENYGGTNPRSIDRSSLLPLTTGKYSRFQFSSKLLKDSRSKYSLLVSGAFIDILTIATKQMKAVMKRMTIHSHDLNPDQIMRQQRQKIEKYLIQTSITNNTITNEKFRLLLTRLYVRSNTSYLLYTQLEGIVKLSLNSQGSLYTFIAADESKWCSKLSPFLLFVVCILRYRLGSTLRKDVSQAT